MLLNTFIASVLMVLSTAIHTGASMLVPKMIKMEEGHPGHGLPRIRVYWLGAIVLLMFFTSLVEVLLWAVTYLALHALEGFERALYFSMVSFTTLGYGDIVLDDRWRLLSSFEAVNGIIMFGWTTALVLYGVQQIFKINQAERR